MKNKEKGRYYGMTVQPVNGKRDVMTVKGYQGEIALLTGDTTSVLRGLWEKVFTEETQEYNDFYFTQKASESRCYSFSEKGSDKPLAMLIRTPYSVVMRTDTASEKAGADYIVGVATDAGYRQQGLMDSILKTALNDMYAEGLPFAFLIPADPAIYSSYGFRYFYFQKPWEIFREKIIESGEYYERQLEKASDEWKQFEKKLTKRKYSVYIRRSGRYYENLFDECRADGGGIVMIYRKSDDSPAGCYSYISEHSEKSVTGMSLDADAEQLVLGDSANPEPFMMGRVVNARVMLGLLRTRKKYDHKVVIKFRINDDIIAENNGCYECRVSDKKCRVKCISEKEAKGCPEMDITDVISLFSRKDKDDSDDFAKNVNKLYSFDRCFFNELS